MAQYQRSWFQLLSGEAHLARIEQLQRRWNLPRTDGEIASLNELALLREYAIAPARRGRARPSAVENALARHRRHEAADLLAWRSRPPPPCRTSTRPAADELLFFRRQPTSDDRILRSLVAADTDQVLASA